MKKTLLLASVSLFLITSCNDDDKKPEDFLPGTWGISKFETHFGNGTVSQPTAPDNCQAQTVFAFGNNNQATLELSSQVDGVCSIQEFKGNYDYDASKKWLMIHNDNETKVYEVISINASGLVIVNEQGDFDNDGKVDKIYAYLNK